MKNMNKKVYSVIVACLFMLLVTLTAFAAPSDTTTSQITSGNSSENLSSNEGEISGNSGNESGNETSSDITNSGEGLESDEGTTSNEETTSGEEGSGTESGSSDESVASSETTETSSKKPENTNQGANIDDGRDFGEWGEGNDLTVEWGEDGKTTSLTSVGTTISNRSSKAMTNYFTVFGLIILIPVIMIIGSIVALVYVNRKSFINGSNNAAGEDKNNVYHKHGKNRKKKTKKDPKRHNISYRPRD